MELRMLGKTGLLVSSLGLGTTKFGRVRGVKYPESYELPSDQKILELFEVAADAGINLIDTAPAYGIAEERIGRILPNPSRWVVVTKVGEEFESGKSRFDFSSDAIRSSIERSRKRLKRDVLDVVLLHLTGNDADLLESSVGIETLAEIKESGKVRSFGASVKTIDGGLVASNLCDVVMVSLSPSCRSFIPVVEAACNAGKGVLVKKPFDSGHYPKPATALSGLNKEPGISSVIFGTINSEHLKANCEALKV